ncbi:hypothetical protein JOQ06_028136, partial [Pogonophryne albipinna]
VSTVFTPGNFQGFALVNRQRTNRVSSGFTVEVSTEGTQLSYTSFDYLGQEPHYWQLPDAYQGDKEESSSARSKRAEQGAVRKLDEERKSSVRPTRGSADAQKDDPLFWKLPELYTGEKVGSYGGKLKFTVSYVAGARGTLIDDGDVQIIGNDITLVARQPWPRRAGGSRETQRFEITFTEGNWRRPDGMPATREHLLMVLADLDDILIRATFSSEMISSSLSELSMDVSVPNYSGLEQSLGVEQCLCPPGYLGLSCQSLR